MAHPGDDASPRESKRRGAPLSRIVQAIEAVAPLGLSEDWDRSGLQVGDPNAAVRTVLISLDPSAAAVAEAARIGAELIVTHHPLLLEPLRNLDLSFAPARVAAECLRQGLAIYSCHTNLDRAEGGVNDLLAALLGLERVRALSAGEEQLKLVVTVPLGYEPRIRRALARAGAGWIGNYSGCTFGSRGVGSFRPEAGANPFLGEEGREETVEEVRLEAIVPKSRAQQAHRAVVEAHPYEEVALDLYPLATRSTRGALGRVGELPAPKPLGRWAAEVAQRLGAAGVRVVGDPAAEIRTAAVCGGSGASLWREAQRAGAQCLVTGDVKYHTARDAEEAGLSIVDAGHWATEAPALEALRRELTGWASRTKTELRVEVFREPDPFRWVSP
ncbi:MAG: Nif3-like dinuclear metal center hexameric protein [Deltaproteobacteria bacterium]|nr:Nif3-like dinuclear metal center hexameric protein [Deltaproteobacteria bacterium]